MNDIFNENVPLKTETPAFAKHVLPAVPSSEVYLEDCVKALKRFNDNHFDLAIVDPPYGINYDVEQNKQAEQGRISNGGKWKQYHKTNWDNEIPTAEYWSELFRVSKNQIIWGGNYFGEVVLNGVIIWNKGKNGNMKDGEMAKTSFNTFKIYNKTRVDAYINNGEPKIHPTQKPTSLYDFILKEYAKPNDLILDTHLGSGSSRIAAYKGGFNFVGFEIDQEYYEKQEKRFNDFKSQLRLF